MFRHLPARLPAACCPPRVNRATLLLVLLAASASAGCPATTTQSCADTPLSGLRCDQLIVGLTANEQQLYCEAWAELPTRRGYGDGVTCGTMTDRWSTERCLAVFSTTYLTPTDPRCPWTVGDSLRCSRDLLAALAAQRDRGEACTAWPVIDGCIPERREPQSEWQFCDPRMNPDAGAGVDAGP